MVVRLSLRFTTFHKTYQLLIYDILWSQITDWVGAVVNRKSLKTNVECTSLQWGIMLFHHFYRLTSCKYHTQNKMYIPFTVCIIFKSIDVLQFPHKSYLQNGYFFCVDVVAKMKLLVIRIFLNKKQNFT